MSDGTWERKTIIKDCQRVVVKVGSGVLTNRGEFLDPRIMKKLARDLTRLRQKLEVVMVSSGAIAAGMGIMGMTQRPRDIPHKQATAAMGQSQLMHCYEKAFGRLGPRLAQILLTGDDFRHRQRYLNARNTLFALLEMGAIPIVNENDTVSVEEIKFGDNDNLSALVATLVEAHLLVILTDTEGLFTADPRKDAAAKLIPLVKKITPEIETAAGSTNGVTSVGGMSTKISAAKIATSAGIPLIIADGLSPHILPRIFDGEPVGTLFVPSGRRLAGKKRWLAYATQPHGEIVVDEGAKTALIKGNKSLLPSGIVATRERFKAGDIVKLTGPRRVEFARGLANYDAQEIERIKGRKTSEIESILGYKHSDEVVHRDNLVILERKK